LTTKEKKKEKQDEYKGKQQEFWEYTRRKKVKNNQEVCGRQYQFVRKGV